MDLHRDAVNPVVYSWLHQSNGVALSLATKSQIRLPGGWRTQMPLFRHQMMDRLSRAVLRLCFHSTKTKKNKINYTLCTTNQQLEKVKLKQGVQRVGKH